MKPFLALICLGLGNLLALLALCPLVCILWLSHLSPLELSQTLHVLKAGPPPVESNCWCLLVSLFIKKRHMHLDTWMHCAHICGPPQAIYTYTDTYILSIFTHSCIVIYKHTHTHIYMYIYICIYEYMYIYIYYIHTPHL